MPDPWNDFESRWTSESSNAYNTNPYNPSQDSQAEDREQLYEVAYLLSDGSGHQVMYGVRMEDVLPVLQSKFRSGESVWLRPAGTKFWSRSDPRVRKKIGRAP